MTAIYALLTLGFFIPLGSLARDMWREELVDRTAADIKRLTAPLPPQRESLLPLPPVHQPPRVRPAWDTPTGQFWVIVDHAWDPGQRCSHCAAPEDKERPCLGCPGCSCPCRSPELVEVAA